MTRKTIKPKQKNISSENVEELVDKVLTTPVPPSLAYKYWCGCCNFSAKTPSGFRNHLYSTRHYRNWSNEVSSKDVYVSGVSTSPKDTMLFNERVSVSSSIDAGVASNDIIHLLDEIDGRSDASSGTEPELVVKELDEIESDVESEYASASASENESDMNEPDEDIDLPLYGTGLFYPDEVGLHRSRLSEGSQSVRALKEEPPRERPVSLLMATAFVLGMVAERCFSQFVRNLCAC